MTEPVAILFCHCAYSDVVGEDVKRDLFRRLSSSSAAFEATADLCELAARRDSLLRRLAQAPRLAIVACHPRAVRWLFAAAGAPLTDGRVKLLDMRARSAGQILAELPLDAPGPGEAPEPPGEDRRLKREWIPWFPVIDRDRCQSCKQCLNFCLFGVYEEAPDGRVVVANPANCKTNCPACARLCPATAIIFPKYKSGAIAGVGSADAAPDEKVKVDLAELLAGDVHEALRRRSGQSKAPCSCSQPVAEQLEIPPEALAALAERVRARQAPSAGSCCDDRPPTCPCCGADE